MGFKNDLIKGKKVEHEVCNWLKEKNNWKDAKVIDGYEKGYDITSINGNIEVKFDPMSDKTGNFVVEIEFGGKPSALETTTADLWVFVDSTDYYFISPDALREVLKGQKWRIREFVGKGDRKKKKAYLVPKTAFIHSPYFKIISRNIA